MRADILQWQKEATDAGETSRRERSAADSVYSAAFNLNIKNPHTVADEHGDPDALLAQLAAAEAETAALRDQLKAILAEALAR